MIRQSLQTLTQARATPWICGALLFGGLVVDLNTNQRLVVAIIYNIPIALAGVLLSQRLTTGAVGLALLANLAAAFDNATLNGGFDRITVLNRLLAALTFLIVGGLSLLFEQTADEVEELHDVEDLIQRERDIRHLLTSVSGHLGHDDLVARALPGLRTLLDADAVVVVGLAGDRFAEPRWADPAYSTIAQPGKLATWAVDALPVTATPVITVRSDAGISSVGRWRSARAGDLVIVADRPTRPKASELLGEALRGLEPLRDRAVEVAPPRHGIAAAQRLAHDDTAGVDGPPASTG